MRKEFKSKKYQGVYYRVLEDKSKTFYIVYKDPITKKTSRLKIGNSKDGFNEAYRSNKRSEILSKSRLGEDINIPILKAKTHFLSLNDIALKYFEHKSLNMSNINISNKQSRYNKHFKDNLGTQSLQTIKKNHILKLQKKLIDLNYANSTINGLLQFGSTLFNFAIKEGLFEGLNPFKDIKSLSEDNDRLRYLDLTEIKTLKDYIKNDTVLLLFVCIATSTGARLESILNLQKKDINFNTNSINIYDFKNKSSYTGALTQEVKKLLIEGFNNLKKDDYIVSYTTGAKIDKKRIQRRLSPILNKLFNKDLKKDDRKNRVVIHTLRHTFASLLAINGTPLYTIQKLMNHKDLKQTTRYAKLSPESGINAVQQLFD